MVALLHPGNDLALHAHHCRGCELSVCAAVGNFAEFAGSDPALEFLPDAGIRGFSHAACQRRFEDCAAVLYRRSLKDMIPGPSHGPLSLHLRLSGLMLPVPSRLCDNAVGLVAILSGQLPVPPQDFLLRQQFLAVARVVRGDLRRRSSIDALLPQMILDLFPARAGRLQILFRISLDFRLPMLAAFQFVAQLLKAQRQLRAVYRSDVSLRDEDLMRLKCARLAVVPLCDVEEHGMSM